VGPRTPLLSFKRYGWSIHTPSPSPTTSMMAFELSSVYICYIDYALITKKPCIILHCIVFSKNTLSLNALISGYLSYPSPYGADLDPCGRRAECDVRYLPFRAPKLSRSVAGFQLFICRHADFASRIICWNRLFPTILGLIEWGAYRMIRSRIPVVSLNIVDCKQQPSCHHMPI